MTFLIRIFLDLAITVAITLIASYISNHIQPQGATA